MQDNNNTPVAAQPKSTMPVEDSIAWQSTGTGVDRTAVMVAGRSWYRDDDPKVAAQPSVPDDDLIEWLDAEVSAIPCRYRGDPSYDHDAYWMRGEVLELLEQARKVFAPTPPAADQAQQPSRNPITLSILRDDSGGEPAYCVMAAYRTWAEAKSVHQFAGGEQAQQDEPCEHSEHVRPSDRVCVECGETVVQKATQP